MSRQLKGFSLRRQTFGSLTAIMGSALGLPVIMAGGLLAKVYGDGVVLSSVLIGNFVLWFIGLAIISMVEGKKHALENIGNYLGGVTASVAAVIWVLSFVMWYSVQLSAATQALDKLIPSQLSNAWLVGGVFGSSVALLSMGSLRLIKKLSVVAFPFLIGFAIYCILSFSHSTDYTKSWGISFVGILSIVFIWLPFTVNLPTVFRYSVSKVHAIIALSLITIFRTLFQIFAISVDFGDPIVAASPGGLSILSIVVWVFFILLSCTVVNMMNVYFAVPGLDKPSFGWRDRTKLLAIGLFGTSLYVFIEIAGDFLLPIFSAAVIEGILSSFITILGVVLLFDFFIKAITRHRLRAFEKFWSSICWLAGCLVVIITQIRGLYSWEKATFFGIATCAFIFLMIIFIEETIWSIRYIKGKKRKT